jgi:hypothetical protein
MRKSLFAILLAYYPLTLLATSERRPVQFSHGHREIPTYIFSRAETAAPLFKSVDNAGHDPYTALDRDSLSRQPVRVQYNPGGPLRQLVLLRSQASFNCGTCGSDSVLLLNHTGCSCCGLCVDWIAEQQAQLVFRFFR